MGANFDSIHRCTSESERVCGCGCVCVCVRETERDRENKGWNQPSNTIKENTKGFKKLPRSRCYKMEIVCNLSTNSKSAFKFNNSYIITQKILNVAERMRLPPGSSGRPGPDRLLLGLRTSLVRGSHRLVHQPRQVAHQGVGMLSSGRKAPVLGNQVS